MAARYQGLNNQHSWLVTGGAGFIGSNILEHLLKNNQKVTVIDNFSSGKMENIDAVLKVVSRQQQSLLEVIDGDVCDLQTCIKAAKSKDFVVHQAALGSVPHSIEVPNDYVKTNINGFVHILEAARLAGAKRVIYASSSAVYGDNPDLPKTEEKVGRCLSPYAATKLSDEVIAHSYSAAYGMTCVGLRYFNVFGMRQNPDGYYAAVIPKWVSMILAGQTVEIYGDGETSRDFCFIDNVVQANIISALADITAGQNYVMNVANGQRTSLNQLYTLLKEQLSSLLQRNEYRDLQPVYRDFRPGDIRHSHASIELAQKTIGFHPEVDVETGLRRTLEWSLAR